MTLYAELTDDQWAQIEMLIPPARSGGNKRRVDMRSVVNAIMYRLIVRTTKLPENFPPRTTLNEFQSRWIASGVLDTMFETLGLPGNLIPERKLSPIVRAQMSGLYRSHYQAA